MRILLSDGSGLTARQCATRLAEAGHIVEVLAPDPLCLCRFTRHVTRLHRVPAYGPDPLGWLGAALEIYRSGPFDVLFPTQEQVAVLSWAKDQLETCGVRTAIPPFNAVLAVQDKISASATLCRLGIPQPETATELEGWDRFPAFVKDPIGTASGGVRKVNSRAELEQAAATGRVLVQAAADGPLLMCQSVFDHGALVAFHANERTAEGVRGGASHKRSVSIPDVRHFFELLGSDLQWHGALSADVILSKYGPLFIDINPRLVEPQNAYASGVDLVHRFCNSPPAATQQPNPRADRVSPLTSSCSPCSAPRSTAEDAERSSLSFVTQHERPATISTPPRSSPPWPAITARPFPWPWTPQPPWCIRQAGPGLPRAASPTTRSPQRAGSRSSKPTRRGTFGCR